MGSEMCIRDSAELPRGASQEGQARAFVRGGRIGERTGAREAVGQARRRMEGSGWIFGGIARVSDGGKRSPATEVTEDRFCGAHRATVGRVIPWSGCVPAEPASVSPGETSVTGNDSARQARLSSGSGKVIVVGLSQAERATVRIGKSNCRWHLPRGDDNREFWLSLIGKNNCRLTRGRFTSACPPLIFTFTRFSGGTEK